uniref:Ig-like domain-containing protein n=1 Tax=Oryzias sinensis TaxID=183150 RepID=A0A8C7XHN5_9TELE
MSVRLAACLFLCVVAVPQTLQLSQKISITEANFGENVIMKCTTVGLEQRMVYWHKLQFGFMIQTIAFGSSPDLPLKEGFNNSRYSAKKEGNEYSLEIRNVSKEDQGTYFCQAGTSYTMTFIYGSHLVVKGSNLESVSPGSKVNRQCSLLWQPEKNPDRCLGEQRAYLYRAGFESEPDIIYTTSSRCDDQEDKSCVYHVSKPIKNSSDPGLYSCAVSSCGQILFGEDTEEQIRQGVCPYVVILGTLLACCVLANIILIVTWKKQNPVCDKCKDGKAYTNAENDGPAGDQQTDLSEEDDGLHYVALEFSSRKSKRQRSMRRESKETCIYANKRDY